MNQTDWAMLGIALALAIVVALIAATEAALSSFSRSRAERLIDEGGGRRAERVLLMMADPAPYLNTALFLRIVGEVTAIALVAHVVFEHVGPLWARLLTTAGSMLVVSFILWGVAPRTLGRQRADGVALAASGPLSVATTVFGPIAQLMILIGNALTPGRGYADGPFSSEAELREFVDMASSTNVIEDGERKMIHSVFELGDTIVKEVMVPRTEMVYIEADKTLRQGLSLALRSGFSRIPVIGEDLDDVVGVLYLKDVIKRLFDNPKAQSSEQVGSLMRAAAFCPDSKPADELLQEMQRTHSHLVIVVDEFGGTSGLATIEDLLEEIVGEIVDEYDAEIAPFVKEGEGVFRVSSRLPVDELGELFGLKVDDEEVDTVLGLMGKELNKVPIPGSVVRWEGIELTADRGTGRRHRIATVLARRIDDGEDAATDNVTRVVAEENHE